MGKLLVTGATGSLGGRTLELLLLKVPANQVAVLVRNPESEKMAGFIKEGVEVHQGDYFDYNSLMRAFTGVEKVMLISAQAFTDRNTQHFNVIAAAKQAGVQQVIYTSIIRREDSGFIMPEVTISDTFAEQALKASGLAYTIMRNPPYLEVMQNYFGSNAYEVGVRVPEGSGKVAAASLYDLAAANVAVLTHDGHENKTYTLNGSEARSFADIAEDLSEISGKRVAYVPISEKEYVENFTNNGFPLPAGEFLSAWVRGINSGEFSETSGDLERLIGRKPMTFKQFYQRAYSSSKN
ncbi:NAD(P)H dehydrogenase (quinone) [Paenibacillus rhizosphaerae]|uniref:NAD(P)H dehydrogenase (Quinone) n=1 Tax=Paenibacillus rhizosphaerae TaxID=297318 RepID=A0A839TQA6_9BACL|nr:SDR family oxidoreductase [Paenibacillus rhizosphaerae]MBB3128693.1 NAD(P)H dehydrogenase (quinone) [Paenibacillus rhizosphaerae]